MQRFNRKPKGAPKGGAAGRQRSRPKGGSRVGQKKPVLSPKEVQALAQQKTILENRIRGLLEEIRRSGKPCLDRGILAKYRRIERMAGLIRKIDRETGGKAPNARFGTTKIREKRKK